MDDQKKRELMDRWLARARSIDREIETLRRIGEKTRATAAELTQEPDALQDFEDQLAGLIDRLLTVKAAILNAISFLPSTKERDVLACYFVEGLTLEAASKRMFYSYKQTKRIKTAAMQHLVELAERGVFRCS